MFNSILEDTIFESMLEEDINELESYDRTLVDSVLETNDIDLDKCDDDDCDSEARVEVLEEVQDRGRGLRVERGCGLVREYDLRVCGEDSCDCDPLALSAGELCGVCLCLVGKSDDLQHFRCLPERLPSGDA